MTESALESLRGALSALGEPHRFRLAMLLNERARAVGELVELTGLAQPLVSHHLAILCRAGVAASEREGRRRLYRLVEPEDAAARDLVRLVRRVLLGPAPGASAGASAATAASPAGEPLADARDPRDLEDYLL